jgi:hypothetical protein
MSGGVTAVQHAIPGHVCSVNRRYGENLVSTSLYRCLVMQSMKMYSFESFRTHTQSVLTSSALKFGNLAYRADIYLASLINVQ